ncbi:MAG TPA: glutamate formimidoyltransferase [bacterium]|nr:glutamate formimidoyltransferase [bacterium]HPR88778.1 glutamate formimidoyltransferase [bacterium]
MKLVECVPNFSEGRDAGRIEQIAAAIRGCEGVKLLDIDAGKDTNRTVMTVVGAPDAVAAAAFAAIARAAEVIDMSRHKGAHPRMGATDVCPFIPVSGVTMAECAELARHVGERVGRELAIPVYLYEAAAAFPQRRNLADIRAGEYEGLPDKLADPAWQPDFGPAQFHARAGATVIGAREFLIAYNINLNTRDSRLANEIAGRIRETGRPQKDEQGKILRDAAGEALRHPGLFQACKAVGWYMEDFGRAQISINLTNYRITPPHLVFDACCRLAEEMGARVTGSELVGLIPLEAMLEAGRYFLRKQGRSTGVAEEELVHIAVLSLGLDELYPFAAEKKIIEYQLREQGALVSMTLAGFTRLLASEAPAPGGGSVAALCGALSSALTAMVGALTHGKKGYEAHAQEMEEIGIAAQTLKDDFLLDVDRDTAAFNQVMEAFKLPKKSDEEKAARAAAIEAATRGATLVPLAVLRRCLPAVQLAHKAVQHGNKNSISDAGVAALAGQTAAEGAYFNVCINLAGLGDADFKTATRAEAEALRTQISAEVAAAVRLVEESFS